MARVRRKRVQESKRSRPSVVCHWRLTDFLLFFHHVFCLGVKIFFETLPSKWHSPLLVFFYGIFFSFASQKWYSSTFNITEQYSQKGSSTRPKWFHTVGFKPRPPLILGRQRFYTPFPQPPVWRHFWMAPYEITVKNWRHTKWQNVSPREWEMVKKQFSNYSSIFCNISNCSQKQRCCADIPDWIWCLAHPCDPHHRRALPIFFSNELSLQLARHLTENEGCERLPLVDSPVTSRELGDCLPSRELGDCLASRELGDCLPNRELGDCLPNRVESPVSTWMFGRVVQVTASRLGNDLKFYIFLEMIAKQLNFTQNHAYFHQTCKFEFMAG